jgi:hypothetical protein
MRGNFCLSATAMQAALRQLLCPAAKKSMFKQN